MAKKVIAEVRAIYKLMFDGMSAIMYIHADAQITDIICNKISQQKTNQIYTPVDMVKEIINDLKGK
jgi:hypothetical protein